MGNYYTEELQQIYNSEINFSISCFWDGGFTVQLGDKQNGFKAGAVKETIEQAVEWLVNEVMERYPGSLYSAVRVSLINKIREGFVDTNKFTFELLGDMIFGYRRKHPGIYLELAKEYQIKQKERIEWKK